MEVLGSRTTREPFLYVTAMNNAPADPLSWYWEIPIVTRVYLTVAFATTVSQQKSEFRTDGSAAST